MISTLNTLFKCTNRILILTKRFKINDKARCTTIITMNEFIFHSIQNYPSRIQNSSSQIRSFSNGIRKEDIQIKTVKSREIIKDVLEKKREFLIEKKNYIVKDIKDKKNDIVKDIREKKNDFVKDIREKKTKVKAKMEEAIIRENIITIPNILTLGRAILAPYLGYIIIQGDYTIAMGLLIVAGITDLLDGKIARYWPNQASKFGSFLDPLADKLLVGSLVISLGCCDLLPIWLSGMILFRDAFLIGAGFVIRYISLPPPKTLSRYFDATHVTAQLEPTFISKINTAVQLFTIGLSLGAPIWNYVDNPLLCGLWYLTGFTTAAAAISYLTNKNTYKVLKNSSRGI